ncbi:MAG: RlmE family RNA methyltransferase [Alphaproteobacteria bacterium]
MTSIIKNTLGGRRGLTVKVKSAKGRKKSSVRWLQRQLNDPYVAEANRLGYRSRAAFKLLQLDEKYNFLAKNKVIVDLGCAPGGWLQVASKKLKGTGKLIGLDILETKAVENATIFCQDFTTDEAYQMLQDVLGEQKVDVVMSDMAANTTGHQATDHLRTLGLIEIAHHFAVEHLKEGGIFVAKVFQGGAEPQLLKIIKSQFDKVSHFKPDASRKDSPETYLIAQGFKCK